MLKNLPANAGEEGLIPGLGRSSGGGKWQSNPVFLPGKFHGQRSLVAYSPWRHKESDKTEPRAYACCMDIPQLFPSLATVYSYQESFNGPRQLIFVGGILMCRIVGLQGITMYRFNHM